MTPTARTAALRRLREEHAANLAGLDRAHSMACLSSKLYDALTEAETARYDVAVATLDDESAWLGRVLAYFGRPVYGEAGEVGRG